MENKKTGDCIAVLEIDSPAYLFIVALQSIHKQQGEYDYVDFYDISSLLPFPASKIVNDFENGILEQLLGMKIIEQASDGIRFKIHPDHQVAFNRYPTEPQ